MIPDFQTLMRPVLENCQQGSVSTKSVTRELADRFDLTEPEFHQLLPSGQQTIFSNRVNWAKSYLKQADLLWYPERSHFEITEFGRKALSSHSGRIDVQYLNLYPAFREFRTRKNGGSGNSNQHGDVSNKNELSDTEATSDETLRESFRTIKSALASELLDKVMSSSPDFFEDLIVTLLLAMGYGGSGAEAGRTLGKSGDDGVDGVIDQDPLGC